MKTYPKMIETVKDLLRRSNEPMSLYILARLEELENQVQELTPPNAPLTLEELREIDDPVWVECGITAFTPDGGYYSLCKNGHITTPSGIQYIAEDIPHWKFYRRKPEEGTP